MRKLLWMFLAAITGTAIVASLGTLIRSGTVAFDPDYTAKVYFDEGYKSPDGNVILVSIDTLRADHLGCYGYGKNTTPNIDEFSRDSILFSETIAQAPSTKPSHASSHNLFVPKAL